MITKEQYEDSQVIEDDKEKFEEYALNKGFDLLEIEDFIISYYENLRDFDYNLRKLKEVLEEE